MYQKRARVGEGVEGGALGFNWWRTAFQGRFLGAEREAVWRCSKGRRYGRQIFSLARDSGVKTCCWCWCVLEVSGQILALPYSGRVVWVGYCSACAWWKGFTGWWCFQTVAGFRNKGALNKTEAVHDNRMVYMALSTSWIVHFPVMNKTQRFDHISLIALLLKSYLNMFRKRESWVD